MQQRRLRPGDVLDDYCPRERRITDHAIVAMIEDHIKQTRCVVCDAEHEYKEGKVPAQRRKKAGAGLFGQVLEGLQPARLTGQAESSAIAQLDDPLEAPDDLDELESDEPVLVTEEGESATEETTSLAAMSEAVNGNGDEPPPRDEGPVRRSLIRATLPRPEGQVPPARALPEFTIRQPNNPRGGGRGRRRRGGHQGQGGGQGFTRFGQGGQGGQRQHGPRNHGPNGPRRRGKKK